MGPDVHRDPPDDQGPPPEGVAPDGRDAPSGRGPSPEPRAPGSSGRRYPRRALLMNGLSLAGFVIAAVSLANTLFLFVVDMVAKHPAPYLGILAYMVGPAILIFGIALVLLGMWVTRRRFRRLAPEAIPRYPRIDFNDRHQRRLFFSISVFAAIFVLLSAIGSYRAYEFTDSVTFCGQLCHSVMHPEYAAYELSPHARVRCVDCHVGPGASWYVRSKLSGLYQVYATIFDTYPRPIPTPVENLRPAQETCEQCHWPRMFWGAQLKVFTHYANDEQNTPSQMDMLLKTGGGHPVTTATTGIHWHMNIANKIEYYAADHQRQKIPYVRITDPRGEVTDYVAKDSSMTPEDFEKAPKRVMDCVDCHNRPTHIFTAPDIAVDRGFQSEKLDPKLPYLRQQAVAALKTQYKSTDEAMKGIAGALDKFYSSQYPDIHAKKKAAIESAVAEVQRIYRSTTFPSMHVDWTTHPNNIGHLYFPGCFRCHDGRHLDKEGKAITRDCHACHLFLGQKAGYHPMGGLTGSSFNHPIDLSELGDVSCTDCHGPGQ